MPVQNINTIKNWFVTGAKPLQQQFWDWLDSFRHKDDKIAFTDLTNALQNDINSISGFPITLSAGVSQWTVPVDMVIEFVRVYDPGTINWKMGTTNGGEEIWPVQEVTANNRIFRQDIDAAAGTTYYFGGVTASTVIKIYKR